MCDMFRVERTQKVCNSANNSMFPLQSRSGELQIQYANAASRSFQHRERMRKNASGKLPSQHETSHHLKTTGHTGADILQRGAF